MPAPNRIRAVIFDMDGVLTDSEPLICAAATAMFGERGVTVRPEDFQPFVGMGEIRYLGGVAEKYHLQLNIEAAKRRTYELYLEMAPDQLRAFPGAVELVRACRKAGLQTAVASSADRIKVDANLRLIELPRDNWDVVIAAEDVVHKKPAPDIFLAAAHKMKLPPPECIVIEDAVSGIQAAKAAGMRCVAVAHTFSQADLAEAEHVWAAIKEITLEQLLGHYDG